MNDQCFSSSIKNDKFAEISLRFHEICLQLFENPKEIKDSVALKMCNIFAFIWK